MVNINQNYTFYIAVVTTLLALLGTTWYMLRRLFSKEKHAKSAIQQGHTISRAKGCEANDANDASSSKNPSEDTDATDGDDEADEDDLDRLAHMEELEKLQEGQDPVNYCRHIQGEVKKVKQKLATKRIQETLTQEQIDEERQVQQQQLEAIFKLMQEQSEKFGFTSMDDVREQLSLYNV